MKSTSSLVERLLAAQRKPAGAQWFRQAMAWPLSAACVLTPVAAAAQAALPAPPAQTTETAPAAPQRTQVKPGQVLTLPGGGRLWATEDPANLTPQMNVSAQAIAGIRDDRLSAPHVFNVSTNYASFMDRMELLIFNGRDTDLVKPLVRLSVPVNGEGEVRWDGVLPAGHGLRPGDTMLYVVRATGKSGQADETVVRSIRLSTEEEWLLAKDQLLSESNQQGDGFTLDQRLALEAQRVNGLAKQNIPLSGSIVRIYGQDIPDDVQIKIAGKNVVIDLNRRFVAEYLLPVGAHDLKIETVGLKEPAGVSRALGVKVSGEYFFMVGMADFYLSKSSLSGNIEPASVADGFDEELLKEGRLAFYLKGKIQGKYLITAQADTEDQELNNLFRDFFKATPQDIFRRLDPDQYYPVYGDDSTSYRDVDSAGKLYVRLDWDKNQAIWGNFHTQINGGEFNQYNRTLYGAALKWRSNQTTRFDDPSASASVFISEAQTAKGYSDLLGTGGSLYYLKHTDILRGSEQLYVEVRDTVTGQVVERKQLAYGTDYEIDYIQGRIILTRPLDRNSVDAGFGITRLSAAGDHESHLLVDYEYIPDSVKNMVVGGRGQIWAGDHVAVGGTYVSEDRDGDDYQLKGVDITLRAGRGTYLKAEVAESESTQTDVHYSDNGGLTYMPRAVVSDGIARSGQAVGIEARANLYELGWTPGNVSVGAWYKDRDAGYSTARAETGGLRSRESGVESLAQINDDLDMGVRLSQRETDSRVGIEQLQVVANWRLDDVQSVGLEVRRVRSSEPGEGFVPRDVSLSAAGQGIGTATYAGVRYKRKFSGRTEGYAFAQSTLQSDDDLKNNRVGIGATHRFGERSSATAEVSTGNRGAAGKLEGNYYVTPNYNLYSRYAFASQPGDIFGSDAFDDEAGRTLAFGQRWNAGSGLSLFQESQLNRQSTGDSRGESVGMDYNVAKHWQVGLRYAQGRIVDENNDETTRRSASALASYNDSVTSFSPKFEYRRDRGAQSRDQYLLSVGLTRKFSEDWRTAVRWRASRTKDRLDRNDDARFTEGSVGLAYRPAANNRWTWLSKYTYLYDLGSAAQVSPLGGVAQNAVDQRAHIVATEALYRINALWEIGGKYAYRTGELREGRNAGAWYKNTRHFAAAQVRLHVMESWDVLVEHRHLRTEEDKNRRSGWLAGIDKQITPHFRLGVGYNFTDFSDDLRHTSYRFKGWYLNAVGVY